MQALFNLDTNQDYLTTSQSSRLQPCAFKHSDLDKKVKSVDGITVGIVSLLIALRDTTHGD